MRRHAVVNPEEVSDQPMSFADEVGAAALIAAIIGIGISVYYGRKALRPVKRKLRWHFSADPLFPHGQQDFGRAIEVRVNDHRIHDAHLATLTLDNVGR